MAETEARADTEVDAGHLVDGTQAVVVHNADFSLVTTARPLQRNEFAFLYAAGLGRVTNQPLNGNAAPGAPHGSPAAHLSRRPARSPGGGGSNDANPLSPEFGHDPSNIAGAAGRKPRRATTRGTGP